MSYEACFKKLPVLETPRLRLRQISDSVQDGKDSLDFINDYSVYRFWGIYDESKDTGGHHRPKKIKLDYHYNETMKEYRAGRELSWLLELKDTKKVIGEIVLYDFRLQKQADIGYRISKQYWGQGYAPEAGQAMLKTAFEIMDLTRLQIRCFSNNPNSVRIAEKLGFIQEGLIRKGAIVNVMTDFFIFGLLREDYEKYSVDASKAMLIE